MKKSSKTLLEFSKPSLSNYDRLREVMRGSDKATPTNLELFMFAMAFGFKSGNRVEEIVKSGTGPRVEYLSQDNEALMAAVQLATTIDTETLMDLDKRYTIAEQYAEGGIRLLALLAAPRHHHGLGEGTWVGGAFNRHNAALRGPLAVVRNLPQVAAVPHEGGDADGLFRRGRGRLLAGAVQRAALHEWARGCRLQLHHLLLLLSGRPGRG